MATMVDACVYLDVFTRDDKWFTWSFHAIEEAGRAGIVIINPVIYAEISVNFNTADELDALLSPTLFHYEPIPQEAAFLAGKCFREYRGRGGAKLHTLPDFFIGAHAFVTGLALVTRDAKRFRNYFPDLTLICP